MSRAILRPTRFDEAEKINPFQLLIDLHDHALSRAPGPAPDGALAELALAAAATAWWSRWQPITIHAALRAGANVTDVAAATGLDETEVARRWTRWTDVQTTLVIAGRPSVGSDEVRTIRQRIGEEVNP
jgi:hypothetical protein